MNINIFSSYNDLEFHVSKREQLNYCRFEALLRIAVWGLFIFFFGEGQLFLKDTVKGFPWLPP